jgi:hypothetical protein
VQILRFGFYKKGAPHTKKGLHFIFTYISSTSITLLDILLGGHELPRAKARG